MTSQIYIYLFFIIQTKGAVVRDNMVFEEHNNNIIRLGG